MRESVDAVDALDLADADKEKLYTSIPNACSRSRRLPLGQSSPDIDPQSRFRLPLPKPEEMDADGRAAFERALKSQAAR